MFEDDVFGASKRAREDWDAVEEQSHAMDGAFLATTCPDCGRSVSALIRDTDHPHLCLVCPQCGFGRDGQEWIEVAS